MPRKIVVVLWAWIPFCWQPLWGQTPRVRVDPGHKPKQQTTLTTSEPQIGTKASPLVVETHPRSKSEEESAEAKADKDHAASVEGWTLAFAGAAALFTGLLVWIGWRGVNAANRTLEAIERQEALQANSQRSWVLVDKINEPIISDNTPEELAALAGVAFFGCSFKVFGSTPIMLTNIRLRFHLQSKKHGVTPSEPDLPDEPDYKIGTGKGDYIPPRHVKAPGQHFISQRPLEDGALKPEQITLIEGRMLFVCAYGFVSYLDAFEQPHETRFCYIHRVSTLNWIAADTGKNVYPTKFAIGGPEAYNRHT